LPVRYEDLVRRPETVLRELCCFADLPFTKRLLNVPHVNRSETPYNTDSDTGGFDDSRVYYYHDELSPEEEAVARQLVNSDRLQALYPALPPAREYQRGAQARLMLSVVGKSVGSIIADHAAKTPVTSSTGFGADSKHSPIHTINSSVVVKLSLLRRAPRAPSAVRK
jgi:hypothetical protein